MVWSRDGGFRHCDHHGGWESNGGTKRAVGGRGTRTGAREMPTEHNNHGDTPWVRGSNWICLLRLLRELIERRNGGQENGKMKQVKLSERG